MKNEFRKYLWYALGEIILVIIGILFALQINGYYQTKNDVSNLHRNLKVVKESITNDLISLEKLKDSQSRAILNSMVASYSTSVYLSDDAKYKWYDASLIQQASNAIKKAQQKQYFRTRQGGYKKLENGGLLNNLSDDSIESLLTDYYQATERLVMQERDLNNEISQLTLQYKSKVTEDIHHVIAEEPLILWTGEGTDRITEELIKNRSYYIDSLEHPITQLLLRSVINQSLLQNYEYIISLGNMLVKKITNELEQSTNIVNEKIYEPNTNTGPPIIIKNGIPQYHSYGIFTAPAGSQESYLYSGVGIHHNKIIHEDDYLTLRYLGGQEWGYIFFKYGEIDISFTRLINDYSIYDRIQLILKRDSSTDCNSLKLEIKDIDDIMEGGLTSIPLNLGTDWKTYTFDLSQFIEADLSKMNILAGFLFQGQNKCSISIKDIRYLEPN